jgi:ADP-heptose:LPS heptosyltransferase
MMKRRHAHKSNVLLVNITRLGDMLQATPTIAGMKEENPECKITVLVEKQFEDVCHSIPHIDEVISLDLGMTVRCLAREGEGIIDAYQYLSEVVEDLRERNFDYCLNMSSSAYTALLLKLVGVTRSGGWSSDEEGYRVIESDWAKLFATSVYHQNRQYNSLNLVDVFRCSADVEAHPQKLLIKVEQKDRDYVNELLQAAAFTNTGPLVVLQAGASQIKRQWSRDNFVRYTKLLVEKFNTRVVMTGSSKELPIIDPIKSGCDSPNVTVVAGKTNIPQLAALLEQADLLVTGDTGPMHMSVAVGTPVVSMFLASAYGFETGPYSEGNLVLQPVIGCGPCNPNKPCARPDCHETIVPEVLAELTALRLQGDVQSLPAGLVDPHHLLVYRTCFDARGFYNMQCLNSAEGDSFKPYREAYRLMWLDDLGGYEESKEANTSVLKVLPEQLMPLEQVVTCAQKGQQLIKELEHLIRDTRSATMDLARVNETLVELDRRIEQIGFQHGPLGPLTRMFVFGKENIAGSEALELASQMGSVYQTLERRARKFAQYYQQVA